MKKRGTEEMEIIISRSLQVGVLLSAAVMCVGLVLFFVTGSSGYPGGKFPTSPSEILRGLTALRPYAVILTGLMLLIATPVFRVAVSLVEFVREKDHAFVVITAAVLGILILSFLLGKVE